MNTQEWKDISKAILKSELAKKNIDYIQLSSKLAELDIHESPANLNSKINRGKFSFAFFIQCMQAIKTNKITIDIKENINEK